MTPADFDECITFAANSYNQRDGYTDASSVAEQFAIHTFFTNFAALGLKGGVLRIAGKLAAFSIGEPISRSVFGVHIEKADIQYHGAYPAMAQQFAAHFAQDYAYLNREEDLEHSGLRKSKLSYHPALLLEKWTATCRTPEQFMKACFASFSIQKNTEQAQNTKGKVIMIYVFLANGFEEVEALAPVDMLRRAKLDVTTVGVTGKTVTGSHGIPLTADITAEELNIGADMEMIVLPGGMPGTLNEEASPAVQAAINYCTANDRWIGAICAAPSILGHKGLLKGKTAVCYTGFEKELTGAQIGSTGVVTDGKIITARGAGVAVDFGLALVGALAGAETQAQIRASILCD